MVRAGRRRGLDRPGPEAGDVAGAGEGATALEVGAVAEEILAEDARRWCFLQVSVTGRNGQDLRLAPAPPRCPG